MAVLEGHRLCNDLILVHAEGLVRVLGEFFEATVRNCKWHGCPVLNPGTPGLVLQCVAVPIVSAF